MSESSQITRPARPRRALVGVRWPLIAAAFLLVAGVAVGGWLLVDRPAVPPSLGQLPDWSLVNQSGARLGSDELRGRPWVASFFFSSCQTSCPKILGAMSRLQTRLIDADLDVILTSISVDPQTDTPAVLAEFGPKYGVIDGRWHLLTGEPQAVRRVVVDGFKTFLGEKVQTSDDLIDIGHGARLVLVDGAGQVRGRYETDDAGLWALLGAARQLAQAQ